MSRIGLDLLCGLGMPPVAFVELAGKLGCGSVTLAPSPIARIDRYREWSFRSTPGLVADTRKALTDNDVRVAAAEGWFVSPNRDVGDTRGDLDLMAELGAGAVTVCVLDPDIGRAHDQLARLCEMAAGRGMGTNVEFVTSLPIGTLNAGLAAVAHVARPECGLVIDAMHLFRTGGSAAEVARLDPALVRRVQVCDVPLTPVIASFSHEATYERLPPGEGELPLRDLLASVTNPAIVGLEIPMRARAEAGEDALSRLRPCVEATLALLKQGAAHTGR